LLGWSSTLRDINTVLQLATNIDGARQDMVAVLKQYQQGTPLMMYGPLLSSLQTTTTLPP
jgi:hypothetical protein